eukprot:3809720-Heterocapsa_arctica.AAC.1
MSTSFFSMLHSLLPRLVGVLFMFAASPQCSNSSSSYILPYASISSCSTHTHRLVVDLVLPAIAVAFSLYWYTFSFCDAMSFSTPMF